MNREQEPRGSTEIQFIAPEPHEIENIANDLNNVAEPRARRLLSLMTIDTTDDSRTPTEIVRHYREAIAHVMANKALDAANGIGRRAAEIVYGVQSASDKIKEIGYNKSND